jgi:propanol-preferring alcohol dehydrogenase
MRYTRAAARKFRSVEVNELSWLCFERGSKSVSLVGLPPGEFATPIFDIVLKRITLRGSIAGAREDLAEAIEFAVEGKVKAYIQERALEEINSVFAALKAGTVDGRIVVRF